MRGKIGLLCGVVVTGLLAAAPAGAAPKRDPAGTTLYMGALRVLFAGWDLNRDGYLSSGEMNRALGSQGPVALIQLDVNGDGQVSRDEYMDWARGYAKQLKKQADLEQKLLAAQQKLATATVGSRRHLTLQGQVRSHQAGLSGIQKQMKQFEKNLQKQLKKNQPPKVNPNPKKRK